MSCDVPVRKGIIMKLQPCKLRKGWIISKQPFKGKPTRRGRLWGSSAGRPFQLSLSNVRQAAPLQLALYHGYTLQHSSVHSTPTVPQSTVLQSTALCHTSIHSSVSIAWPGLSEPWLTVRELGINLNPIPTPPHFLHLLLIQLNIFQIVSNRSIPIFQSPWMQVGRCECSPGLDWPGKSPGS